MTHKLNQTGSDWITCKCGCIFGDTEEATAKEKFIFHLEENGLTAEALYYQEQISKGTK